MIFNPVKKSCDILNLLEETEAWDPRAPGLQGRGIQVNRDLSRQNHLELGVPWALGKDEGTFRPCVVVSLWPSQIGMRPSPPARHPGGLQAAAGEENLGQVRHPRAAWKLLYHRRPVAPVGPTLGILCTACINGVHPPVQDGEEAGAQVKYQVSFLFGTIYKNSAMCPINARSLQVHMLYF